MFSKRWASSNFGERKKGKAPSMVVLHYTGMKTAKEALERLCDPASEVSAHCLIEENGKTHELVAQDKRAWHAGQSYWAGETDVNSASIGIEIVNPGHEFGYTSFPERQIQRTIALCKAVIERWGMSSANILGHSDIAPGRKVDPGHMFPWERLAREGIGLWPRPHEMDYQAAEDLILNPPAIHELLTSYGYNPETPYETLIVEFMRHFHPEKFARADDQPEPDILTIARLLALVRARHDLQT